MWPGLGTPFIFAHRGASAHAPENTLAAFELACEQGADGIELDVKLSADGHVIVMHDPTLERTTNGTGRVSETPLAALRELDAGAFLGEQFKGEPVPTLEEVLDAVGQKLYINIELTNYKTPQDDLAAKTATLVRQHGLQARVLFSSFYAHNLNITAKILPQTPRGLLTLPGLPGWWMRTVQFPRGEYQALHPHLRDVSEHGIARIHAAGRAVNVWTVNDPGDMRRLQTWKADAIFTDDPLLARKIYGGEA